MDTNGWKNKKTVIDLSLENRLNAVIEAINLFDYNKITRLDFLLPLLSTAHLSKGYVLSSFRHGVENFGYKYIPYVHKRGAIIEWCPPENVNYNSIIREKRTKGVFQAHMKIGIISVALGDMRGLLSLCHQFCLILNLHSLRRESWMRGYLETLVICYPNIGMLITKQKPLFAGKKRLMNFSQMRLKTMEVLGRNEMMLKMSFALWTLMNRLPV